MRSESIPPNVIPVVFDFTLDLAELEAIVEPETMRPRRIVAVVAAVPALFVAAVFAYGYWHTATHAVFDVELRDASGNQLRHTDAALTFLDDSGSKLAQSATEGAGSFYLSGQYSCREIEKRAAFEVGGHECYSRCFERLSRWIAEWVDDVRHVDVRIGGCQWKKVPITVSRESTGPANWWLLWPSPHVGGSPLTRFYTTVTVDVGPCTSGK